MNSQESLSPAWFYFLLALLSLSFVPVLIVATSRYGIGLSVDSVDYITEARRLAASVDLTWFKGTAFIVQPPLYPITLAIVSTLFQIDPLDAARVVSLGVFPLAVYWSGLLLLKLFPGFPSLAFLGVCAILFSAPLFQVSMMAWSESLFISLLVVFLFSAGVVCESKKTVWLAVMTISAALAPLTRYVGVVLIPTGGLVLVLALRGTSKTRFEYALKFVAGASLPIGLWLIRNYVLGGTATGAHASSFYTLSQNVDLLLRTVSSWFLPQAVLAYPFIGLIVAIPLAPLVGMYAGVMWDKANSAFPYVLAAALFILIYSAALIVASTTMPLDEIGFRLASPLFIPFIALFLFLANGLRKPLTKLVPDQAARLILVFVLAVGWVYFPVRAVLADARGRAARGAGGFNTEVWRESQTMQYLNEHRDETEYPIYSNVPWALQFLAGLPAQLSPVKTAYHSTELRASLSDYKGTWPASERALLVWFDNNAETYLFPVVDLQSVSNISPVAHLPDGTIYMVSPRR